MIQVQNFSISIKSALLVEDITFGLQSGQWLMICGPNGAGKSSLIKGLMGLLPYQGHYRLMGQDQASLKASQRAHYIGLLDQGYRLDFDYSVKDFVAMGRFPHLKGWFKSWSQSDYQALDHCLDELDLLHLKHQSMASLSGGERQRAYLAQLFLQDPKILVLDEPSNHLDLIYEKYLFLRLTDWLQAGDRMLISVMHDLSLAKLYGSHALVLDQAKQQAFGPVDQVLQGSVLDEVFKMDVLDYLESKQRVWFED